MMRNTLLWAGNRRLARQSQTHFVAILREKITLHKNYLHTFCSSYYFLLNFFLRKNPFDFKILPLLALNSWSTRYEKSVLRSDHKPATDDSQDIHEMGKICDAQNMCSGYFVFLCCIMRHISHVSHLEPFRGISGNYARDKGTFSCDRDIIIVRENNQIAKRL